MRTIMSASSAFRPARLPAPRFSYLNGNSCSSRFRATRLAAPNCACVKPSHERSLRRQGMRLIAKNPARLLLSTILAVGATTMVAGPAQTRAPAHTQPKEREAPPLRLVQEIPLPSVQGRLDHFTIDPKR